MTELAPTTLAAIPHATPARRAPTAAPVACAAAGYLGAAVTLAAVPAGGLGPSDGRWLLLAAGLTILAGGLRRRLRLAHTATVAALGITAAAAAFTGRAVPAVLAATTAVALAALARHFTATRRTPPPAEPPAHPGEDSLAYFTNRDDRTWTGPPTAAVSTRTIGTVLLAGGDPAGPAHRWHDAATALRDTAAATGLVPAVIGASEAATAAYRHAGFHAVYLGDEAVLDLTRFNLTGRAVRTARQSWHRAGRAGYTARLYRTTDLTPAETTELAAVSTAWRRGTPERGFSMALSRLFDPRDTGCLIVVGYDSTGQAAGFLHLVPWGDDNASLDAMRRRPEAPAILNDFLIVEAARQLADAGYHRLSLNFAVQRRYLAAAPAELNPTARLWQAALHLASRRYQIRSLYRFNRKFAPVWVPRYALVESWTDLPRVAIAMGRAEGYL